MYQAKTKDAGVAVVADALTVVVKAVAAQAVVMLASLLAVDVVAQTIAQQQASAPAMIVDTKAKVLASHVIHQVSQKTVLVVNHIRASAVTVQLQAVVVQVVVKAAQRVALIAVAKVVQTAATVVKTRNTAP